MHVLVKSYTNPGINHFLHTQVYVHQVCLLENALL